jgi:hypothetical protein
MNDSDPVRLRCLPEGVECEATICSSTRERLLELDLSAQAGELIPGTAVEICAADTIYLGVVGRQQKQRVWIEVEHLLDRKTLTSIQAAWKE